MKWSIALGRLAGIPVYVHATFALLLGWVGLLHWNASGSLQAVASGILFILVLFGCVVLHELGHALAARRYGIQTRDITLLPIGGVARLEKMPERPIQELWVALAGPAVNVLIAAVLGIWLLATRSFVPLESVGLTAGSFAERLLVVNLFLVVFNMVPAFPMDGGRVLRALLAMRTDYVRATRIAAAFGKGAAILFAGVGLFLNPFLLLIALFIWIGATQEAAMVQTRRALAGIPVQAAMITDFKALQASDPVRMAVQAVLSGSQRDFPVLDQGQLVGVLTQKRLLEVLSREGRTAPVRRATDGLEFVVGPGDRLDTTIERMQASGCALVPVTDGGWPVGLLTLENALEFIAIQEALDHNRPGGGGRTIPPVLDTRAGTATG